MDCETANELCDCCEGYRGHVCRCPEFDDTCTAQKAYEGPLAGHWVHECSECDSSGIAKGEA